MRLDGVALDGATVPLVDDGGGHAVELVVARPDAARARIAESVEPGATA